VNDVVVGHLDANTIHVRDAGATIDAGAGCTPIDAHNARCVLADRPLTVARVETGDMNDRIRSFGNAPPVLDPELIADGGPGDDELIGGESADSLNGGGGGADRMLGAAGADVLQDGDVSGQADADVLVGGPAVDTLVYARGTTPIELNLGDEKTHGEPGEGDSISTVENVVSGSGADRITGDGYANILVGGGGADLLRGGAGNDLLRGDAGNDSVFCGTGIDLARVGGRRDFVAPDCERLEIANARFAFAARPYPAAAGAGAVRFRIGCPVYAAAASRGPCSGSLVLRETRGRARLLGTGKVTRRRSAKPVFVKLTAAGRRLARAKSGVLAVVTLKGKRLPSIGWTIRLRVRG
jgi:Ca2+-binding RTX toxin-like protein